MTGSLDTRFPVAVAREHAHQPAVDGLRVIRGADDRYRPGGKKRARHLPGTRDAVLPSSSADPAPLGIDGLPHLDPFPGTHRRLTSLDDRSSIPARRSSVHVLADGQDLVARHLDDEQIAACGSVCPFLNRWTLYPTICYGFGYSNELACSSYGVG